ncbi:MAG: phosphoribosylglycinamide formyltransferase [Nitriliruptoraceae bacterium]
MSRPARAVRLAVLISGGGSNLRALLDAIAADPAFGGEVVVVGSDRGDAGGLWHAREAGVPIVVEELERGGDRTAWEDRLATGLAEHAPEVVVLAGFMRILSGRFLARWPDRVLNTHPSLLPAFRGAHAVREALEYGVSVTGCTVHLVDEQVDHGPILAQEAVPVLPDDTEDSLHERIKAVEHRLLPACVRLVCHDRLRMDGRRVRFLPPAAPQPGADPAPANPMSGPPLAPTTRPPLAPSAGPPLAPPAGPHAVPEPAGQHAVPEPAADAAPRPDPEPEERP